MEEERQREEESERERERERVRESTQYIICCQVIIFLKNDCDLIFTFSPALTISTTTPFSTWFEIKYS